MARFAVWSSKTFIDVADLLDVERTERKSSRFRRTAARDFHAQELQRFEQVQHDAVVDRQRLGWRCPPVRACGAAFEERVAVGIKQRPP